MGTKSKSVWICNSCGHSSPKWEGKCTACGQWNTMVEERIAIENPRQRTLAPLDIQEIKSHPRPLSEIDATDLPRIKMPSTELNRVLGGGLVPGALVLIGGEPGIGKSTLVLQNTLSIKSRRVLYVSGEESERQIKMRADRLGKLTDSVLIVCETSLEAIMQHIADVKPQLVVIDSIQTIASETIDSVAGSVSQVRECSAQLLRYAKLSGVPVMIIGHINKEGSIAGPKVLEHIVDTVLQFEGDRQHIYRILRPIKNRFGSISELGVYEMGQRGLREVTDPAEMLLGHSGIDGEPLSGTAIGVTMEGSRPFLIEVQALVSTAAYGTPQRAVTGFEPRRLNMLLAVLEKRVGFKLGQKDVFLNIAGGLKVNDPALDLPVICTILSSNVDIPVPHGICLTGEVGLTGEIRPVTRIDQRISEARKLGMETIIVPKGNLKGIDTTKLDIKVIEVARVDEAFRNLFS